MKSFIPGLHFLSYTTILCKKAKKICLDQAQHFIIVASHSTCFIKVFKDLPSLVACRAE